MLFVGCLFDGFHSNRSHLSRESRIRQAEDGIVRDSGTRSAVSSAATSANHYGYHYAVESLHY